MDVARDLKQWMIDAGFTNVQDDVYKVWIATLSLMSLWC